MALRLQDKIAVVTGAAAGIGEGCAQMFASQGARVVGIDRRGADETCDLTDPKSTAALF